MKKNYLSPIVLVLLVALFPYYFLFFRNIGTIRFSETTTVLWIITASALFLFVLFILYEKQIHKAAIITSGLAIFLLYFEEFAKRTERIIPFLYYWHVLYIGIVCVLLLAYLLKKHMSRALAVKLCDSMLLVAAGLFVLNFALAVPKIKQEVTKSAGKPTSIATNPTKEAAQTDVVRPNVYFFIFDEYAGPSNLKRYCDYDNTPFYDQLEAMGFVSSKTSHNKTIDSFTEIPNLLQLDDVNTSDMTSIDKKNNLKNPRLLRLMRDYGYSINLLDSTNYSFLDLDLADFHMESRFKSSFRTFDSYVWKNSVIYPFYGSQDQNKERIEMLRMFTYASESPYIQRNNLFTVGYFSFPHVPYIFDENGNKSNNSDRNDLINPKAYLRQLIYANKLITKMVSDIIAADPNAVIILQSDHGYRLASHSIFWYGLKTYDLAAESEFERNTLNLVYYPAEKLEIEGLDGLTTLEKVLSALLGTRID